MSSSSFVKESKKMARVWYKIDAEGQVVGRLASQISQLLQGKHKPYYEQGADVGDFVVVKNTDKIKFTGKKWDNKVYRWHTGYVGGLKEVKAGTLTEKHPGFVLRNAVMGMLPKNKLRKARAKRLRIVEGEEEEAKYDSQLKQFAPPEDVVMPFSNSNSKRAPKDEGIPPIVEIEE